MRESDTTDREQTRSPEGAMPAKAGSSADSQPVPLPVPEALSTRSMRALKTDAIDFATGRSSGEGDRDYWFLDRILSPVLTAAGPLFLFICLAYLVAEAFSDRGIDGGVRSLAGSLIPLVLVLYLVRFQSELIDTLLSVPSLLGILLSFGAGIGIMLLITGVGRFQDLPVIEFALSGVLWLLVFGRQGGAENSIFSWYYGLSLGFLTYIAVQGFPVLH